jgi:hypothetical protein
MNMIKKILLIILPLVFLYSCSEDKKQSPSTGVETGREFIRASLDGELAEAEKLLLIDTQNQQLFDSYKVYYERLPEDTKKRYRNAGYEINKFVPVDDSTIIINYSNDFMKKPMEIKVVRVNKEWKIDFKFTSGNLPID